MKVNILKDEKHDLEIQVDNLTVAEVLRFYLYQEGADFAVWRREHPSKPLNMKIQSSSKSVRKAVSDAISAIKKDCDKIESLVKK